MIWEKDFKVGTAEGKFCDNRIPKASHNFRNAIQKKFFLSHFEIGIARAIPKGYFFTPWTELTGEKMKIHGFAHFHPKKINPFWRAKNATGFGLEDYLIQNEQKLFLY